MRKTESSQAAKSSPVSLPLVVQLGFSGSRFLFDPAKHPEIDSEQFEKELASKLADRIRKLRDDLHLKERHFFCGISQIAIGADMVFSRTCAELEMPQRLFLPQHHDAFLNARGSAGPDFSEDEKKVAENWMAGPHVIQERVASDSPDRRDRFHETNLEIVRVSDVAVCLLSDEAAGKRGGTREFIELAKRRNCPVLEIRLRVVDGRPELSETLHLEGEFPLPSLPEELESAVVEPKGPSLPEVSDFCAGLKAVGSRLANWKRSLFKVAAFIIIGAHVVATICAVIAMKGKVVGVEQVIPWFLGFELILLLIGFSVHQYLHHSHACGVWAQSRLAAELARSVGSIGRFHCYLGYLFVLPFPRHFRPLLRTLSVLHLRSTHRESEGEWETQRDVYVRNRIGGNKGQVEYNRKTSEKARRWLQVAKRTFFWCSLLAIVSTLVKLLTLCHCLPIHEHSVQELVKTVTGTLAIVLPVLAVAGLSLAGAFDLEARVHISEDMMAFLEEQEKYLNLATSPREYARLLLETETRLLGETANWYARRSFVGVA